MILNDVMAVDRPDSPSEEFLRLSDGSYSESGWLSNKVQR